MTTTGRATTSDGTAEVSRIDRHLGDLRLATMAADPRAAAGAVAGLRETLARLA